jgi:hypothetical protein
MARIFKETDACLCDSGLYFWAYSWPGKLTQTVPPCLMDPRWFQQPSAAIKFDNPAAFFYF